MSRKKDKEIPLIDAAVLKSKEDRAAIVSAWRRVQYERSRPGQITDLHVRELIFYVHACDLRGDGVQIAAEDMAIRLECKPRSVRDIIRRAANEFGLLTVYEERYANGGQKPNRYAINWENVRAINRGESIPNNPLAGDVTRQPPDVTRQPPDVTRHPYKETTRPNTRLKSHSPLQGDRAAHGGDPWEVVVSDLLNLGMGDASGAVRSAQQRGIALEVVTDWIARYVQLTAADPAITIGHLHRWITGRSKPPWLVSPVVARKPSHSIMSDTTRRNMIEIRVRKAGRAAGKSEPEIESAVARAIARELGEPVAID